MKKTYSILTIFVFAIFVLVSAYAGEPKAKEEAVQTAKEIKEAGKDAVKDAAEKCKETCEKAGEAKKEACEKACEAKKEGAACTQTKCPFMDSEINKEIYADYEGKRVYFCCEACKEKFKADPSKCIKEMEDKGIVLDKSMKKEWKEGKEGAKPRMKKNKRPVSDITELQNQKKEVKESQEQAPQSDTTKAEPK